MCFLASARAGITPYYFLANDSEIIYAKYLKNIKAPKSNWQSKKNIRFGTYPFLPHCNCNLELAGISFAELANYFKVDDAPRWISRRLDSDLDNFLMDVWKTIHIPSPNFGSKKLPAGILPLSHSYPSAALLKASLLTNLLAEALPEHKNSFALALNNLMLERVNSGLEHKSLALKSIELGNTIWFSISQNPEIRQRIEPFRHDIQEYLKSKGTHF